MTGFYISEDCESGLGRDPRCGLQEALVTRGNLLPKECYQIRASRERGAPVLQVDLYDEAGELKDAGIWVTDQEGKWTRSVA